MSMRSRWRVERATPQQCTQAEAATADNVALGLRFAARPGSALRPQGRLVVNLNQITLPATDFDRSVVFYRDMGFTLIVHSPPRYARFECPDGDATFSLHSVDRSPGN